MCCGYVLTAQSLTVVSIIRILTIKELTKYPLNSTGRHSPTPSFTRCADVVSSAFIMPAAMWTDIEVYVAVFVACIPNTRQFIWGVILRRHNNGHKLGSEQVQEKPRHDFPPEDANEGGV